VARSHRRFLAALPTLSLGSTGATNCKKQISGKPVSREFAREWQFNGLATIRPSGFRNRRVTGVTRAARQTSHNVT
jgi:hypothetical protein